MPVDAFATGAMRALRGRASRCPAACAWPPATTAPAREERPAPTAVDLRLDAVARLGVDRLMAEVAGEGGPAVMLAPPLRLVPRASTGIEEDAEPWRASCGGVGPARLSSTGPRAPGLTPGLDPRPLRA